MGYTTSTVHGIEVPNSAEANDVPEDIGKVVTALEGGSLVKRLTGAAIAALTAPQKPAGLVVYNTTTNKLQISDGTNFADVDTTPAWTDWTPTLTQGSAVSKTINAARYIRVGDMVTAFADLSAAASGTAGQLISVTLPVDAVAVNRGAGVFWHFDSGTTNYVGFVQIDPVGVAKFLVSGYGSDHGTQPVTLASGDRITFSVTYEAA